MKLKPEIADFSDVQECGLSVDMTEKDIEKVGNTRKELSITSLKFQLRHQRQEF